jgi:hypothetical protein
LISLVLATVTYLAMLSSQNHIPHPVSQFVLSQSDKMHTPRKCVMYTVLILPLS